MQNVDGDSGENVEDSGEDEPALQQELLGKPEWEITKTSSDEALEDILLPAAEDKPEKVNTSNDVDDKLTEIAPDKQLGNALKDASKTMQNLELSKLADSSFIAILEETSLEDFLSDIEETSLEDFLRDIEETSLEDFLRDIDEDLEDSFNRQSRQTMTRLFLYCTVVLSPYETASSTKINVVPALRMESCL